jgi:hydroxypyruvate isomerase
MTADSNSTWNMRFAPHIGLYSLDTPMFPHSVGSLDPVAHINFIASLGFAGIEDNALLLRNDTSQNLIGKAMGRHGLEMGCFAFDPEHWIEPLWTRNDDSTRAHLKAELSRAAAAANRVNGRLVTVLSGRDPLMPLVLQLQGMIENLRRMADDAHKFGITLLIEPLSGWDYPAMLINDFHDAYAVVKAVNHPAVRLMFDVFHVQAMNGNLMRNLDLTYDVVAMVQIADSPHRSEPGSGEINFVNVLRHLQNKGYTGLVELEHGISEAGKAGEEAALERLRNINSQLHR